MTMTDEVENQVHECAVCSTDIEADDVIFTSYSGTEICSDCSQICYRCDNIESVNDTFHTVDGDLWCEDCTERSAYWCENCEEYNSNGSAFVNDRSEHWCDGCLDGAYYCEDCDEWNADGCDRCSENCDDNGNRIIHDYNYRPDAIFHSTTNDERLFFGIEIEVEARDNLKDSAEYAHQLEALDLAYLKHDGSLSNGFEIVTHPMSHEFFKNEAGDFFRVIEGLRSQIGIRVKSWDTRTCGLHIHISRTGFNGGAHMHRFLNLVYSNQEFYEKLAGRSSEQWAKFDDIYMRSYVYNSDDSIVEDDYGRALTQRVRQFKHKLDNNSRSDRYSAVNTNNRETLEMRIFRGSVNGETIKAHIDLAHASVEYTRTLSVKDVREGALSSNNFMWYIIQNVEVYPELVARMNKLSIVGLARQNGSN
jgi:hypothetical protein